MNEVILAEECPECGEVVDAWADECPACGYPMDGEGWRTVIDGARLRARAAADELNKQSKPKEKKR